MLWLCLLIPLGGTARAGECKPEPPEALEATLASAEAAVRKAPSTAAEKLKEAEAMLPCLSGPIHGKALGDLYRLRAIAAYLVKNPEGAKEAMARLATVYPLVQCNKAFVGYGPATLVNQAVTQCESALGKARQAEFEVLLTGFKGVKDLTIDGVKRTIVEDAVSLELSPGEHFSQITVADSFKAGWFKVVAPEDEDARAPRIDLRKLGLVPAKQEVVEVGVLKMDGLPPGTEVMIDGRSRRDLPILRNVEVGERHLAIKTPDGNVMGVSVVIQANQETVYTFKDSSRRPGSGGGGSPKRLAALGSLGVAALSAVGSGVTLAGASGRYSEAEELYAAYQAAGRGSDFDTLYNEADSTLKAGYKLETTGIILGGVAVAAAGAGGFLFATSGSEEVARVYPWATPLPGSGLMVGLAGKF